MLKPKTKPRDLIPASLKDIINVNTQEDLVFLGKQNLQQIRAAHQKTAQTYSVRVKDLDKQIKVLSRQKSLDVAEESYRDVVLATLEVGGSDSLVERLEDLIKQKEELMSSQRKASATVGRLTRLIAQAEEKPCFCNFRSPDYVSKGDEVFLLHGEETLISASRLIPCTVDKVVAKSVLCIPQTRKSLSLTGTVVSPGLVSWWDYEYFKLHLDYLTVWLHEASHYVKKEDYKNLCHAWSRVV